MYEALQCAFLLDLINTAGYGQVAEEKEKAERKLNDSWAFMKLWQDQPISPYNPLDFMIEIINKTPLNVS
jgi:hypothetical protein